MKKLPLICVVSLPMSIMAEVAKYFYQDWEFAKWIGVAIAVDTILGLWKHYVQKDASSEAFFAKFGKKIAIYILLLILANVLMNITVNGSQVGPTQWIGTYICVFMVVREAFSCVENIQAIFPIFPAAFIKRLKDFNERGEYINEENNEDTD